MAVLKLFYRGEMAKCLVHSNPVHCHMPTVFFSGFTTIDAVIKLSY